MTFDRAVYHMMPPYLRNNKTHPRYDEFRVLVSTGLIAMPIMLLFPVFVHYMGRPVTGFIVNDVINIFIFVGIRFFGHYRIPMTLSALTCYWIMYDLVAASGLIYSSNVCIIHMYLLVAIWADKKHGWYAIFSNVAMFGFLYYKTLNTALPEPVAGVLGSSLYAFGMNVLITIFFGGFLGYQQYDQDRDRETIKTLQNQKISLLDETVKKRTEQLNSMRESIAIDFHDETGNMLSAITRQAALLKLKLPQQHDVQPIVESIIANSNGLYASTKDFLWNLNHNGDDPAELFDYLTGYGQVYYNQFDVAFSSAAKTAGRAQFDPMAALNLIFIFKEAMTNVIKHSGATEVSLSMIGAPGAITYALQDNGVWKEAAANVEHYGLANMQRRCQKNGFRLHIAKGIAGTLIQVTAPVNNFDLQNEKKDNDNRR